MDLAWVLAAVRQHWKVLAGLFLLGPLLAGARLATTPVEYRATATAIYVVDGASTVRELVDGGTYVQQVAPSYSQLATSPAVLGAVIQRLGLNVTTSALAARIRVDTPSGGVISEISADAGTPEEAATIANEVTTELSRTVAAVSSGAAGGKLPVSVTTVSPALPPRVPFSPDYLRDSVLGVLAGLLLAGLYLYLRESVSTTVRTKEDVAYVTDAVVLGTILRDPRARQRPIPLETHPHIPRSESFWMLRNSLLPRLESHSMVAVVSARRREGRTSTATNLALALTHAGRRVLLVDGDLRGRDVAPMLGLDHGRGVASAVSLMSSFQDVVQAWLPRSLRGRGVDVLAADQPMEDPSVLLSSAAFARLMNEASESYDLVIVDTPAMLDGTSGTLLAAQSDAVIVVADSRSTSSRDLAEVMSRLNAVAPVVGVVLNKATQTRQFVGRRGADAGKTPTGEQAPAEGAPAGQPDLPWTQVIQLGGRGPSKGGSAEREGRPPADPGRTAAAAPGAPSRPSGDARQPAAAHPSPQRPAAPHTPPPAPGTPGAGQQPPEGGYWWEGDDGSGEQASQPHEPVRQDWSGADRAGHDRAGHDRDHDRTGHEGDRDRTDHERSGHEAPAPGWFGRDAAREEPDRDRSGAAFGLRGESATGDGPAPGGVQPRLTPLPTSQGIELSEIRRRVEQLRAGGDGQREDEQGPPTPAYPAGRVPSGPGVLWLTPFASSGQDGATNAPPPRRSGAAGDGSSSAPQRDEKA